MAVRAVAVLTNVVVDPNDDDKIMVNCTVQLQGPDWGTVDDGRYGIDVADITPHATQASVDIAAAIKADLLIRGVPFGVGDVDTVILLP